MNQIVKPPPPAGKARVKLSRAARNEEVKGRLFDAAAKVVGQYGYAEASVARITSLAGVAQGTFYNHFDNRQALLDQLLPTIGQQMVQFIRARVDTAAAEPQKETDRFRAFFDFLHEVPEFLRILNEAELFAPAGYQQHLDNIATAYVRILKRARGPGGVGDFSDDELEAVVHLLMGARNSMSRRYAYADGAVRPAPEHVISAYEKLLRHGLFDRRTDEKTGRGDGAGPGRRNRRS